MNPTAGSHRLHVEIDISSFLLAKWFLFPIN